MDAIVAYLKANPIVVAALVIAVAILLYAIIKKFFKLAVLVAIVFLLGGGTVYKFAVDKWEHGGRQLLEKAGKKVETEFQKTVHEIGEAVRTSDSAAPDQKRTAAVQDSIARAAAQRQKR